MKAPLVILIAIVVCILGFLVVYSQQHDMIAKAAPGQGAAGGYGSGSGHASGGYGSAPAPASGGYGTAPAAGGYGAPAPKSGGYGAPAPKSGGYGAPAAGGYK
jgi:hypothetical protein